MPSRSFSGFACKDKDWVEPAAHLRAWAKAKGLKLAETPGHVRASYDAPTKLCNRRNEVWVVKASQENN